MRRYELTVGQWELVKEALPENGRRGGQRRDLLTVLNGVLRTLHAGAQWREAPDRYGPWKTVHGRFARWSKDGTLSKILEALRLKLDERVHRLRPLVRGRQVVRASRSAAGARRGGKTPAEPTDPALSRSRGGFGTKPRLVCDGGGVPLAVELTPGLAHASTRLASSVERVRLPRPGGGKPLIQPKALAADTGSATPASAALCGGGA